MTRNDNKARQWGPVPGCGLESSRRRESAGQSLSISRTAGRDRDRDEGAQDQHYTTLNTMSPLLVFSLLLSPSLASININTLPPDLRRLDFLDHIPPRSTINPVWSGDYSAALDGEENKVLLSWSVQEDQVEFQVRHLTLSDKCSELQRKQ